MKLSSKCKYGARLMLDLALHYGAGSVMLKDIARRQEISEKYLSQIIISLKSAGYVMSKRGPRGGYLLAQSADSITLKGIVTTLEGNSRITDCGACKRSAACAMKDIWCRLDNIISDFLGGITLRVLADEARKYGSKQCAMKCHAMSF